MDSCEEVRHSFAGPGEIKRREVVPLDPQQSPGEIKTREVERWARKVGLPGIALPRLH